MDSFMDLSRLWALADWLNGWFPIIVHKVNICLYLNLVWMLGVRFKALNERLIFIVKSSYANSQVILSSEEPAVMLRTIGNIHSQFCKIGHSFNFIFIITLVTSALEIFVFVTLSFYSFIVEMKNDKDLLHLISCTCLILTCSFPMITIVIICNWTKKQACAAAKLIYKIKVQGNNNVLSELIQVFSMQMQHQQLAFSVGGLFTLDPALLQAIMGAITTNLIILVQFGQLENILSKKG
ncbi:putative gustatory receptor 28b isoform X2 [Belonocnema kinseyi]|uniref:putative gustatory receptor 28b isoform X2 n=1 Tax=Belonocnema kinseyi TaxID=2817044 RepID=UPI00143D6001|nr:putative gustatory receptor 28b isoform X2 [Belonocnema kinseyi]